MKGLAVEGISAFPPLSHFAQRHQLGDLPPFLLRQAGVGERGAHVVRLAFVRCVCMRACARACENDLG